MRDWVIRALKTFVEAFLGVFIPAVTALLTGRLPADLHEMWVVLFPVVCAAIAAGITAVWNWYLENNR